MSLKQQGVPICGIAYKDKLDATAEFLPQNGDPYIRIGATSRAAPPSISASMACPRPIWWMRRHRALALGRRADRRRRRQTLMPLMQEPGVRLPSPSCCCCLSASPVLAVSDPAEMLPDQAQEQRAEAIGHQLRCLVCQNESVEDSDADLARDLRHIIRSASWPAIATSR